MEKFELRAGSWYGWVQAPAQGSTWPVGPVLVTSVRPLKSGKGILELAGIKPLHPGGAIRFGIALRVLQHEVDHLVGRCTEGGRTSAIVLSEATIDWMATYCPEHLHRRPVQGPQFIIEGQAPIDPTADEHFARVFGASAEEVLSGTTPISFPANEPNLPAQYLTFDLDRTYDDLDSWFIGRGFTPTVMEEKWFIYLIQGVLTFRRSWTGMIIYEVEVEWRGTSLHLGAVKVNRDPSQYTETDAGYDRELLLYIIDVVLLGKHAAFPRKTGDSDATLRAWSSVGAASL